MRTIPTERFGPKSSSKPAWRRLLPGVLLICAIAVVDQVPAQEPDATFRSDVKVVSILANVMGKEGQLIRDLTKDDFRILENGRPQEIKYFSRDSDLPLTLGLMVDTSMSQAKVMESERSASFRFLDRVMRPKDQVFVTQFDMQVKTPQPLTSDLESVRKALVFVDTPTHAQLYSQVGGGTLLFDAVIDASRNIMANRQGRKALIIMSDGGENGSEGSLQESIDAAHKADTLIYSILFGGTEGRGNLQRMSKETGGGYFEVTKRMGIDQVFDAIQEELRSQYNLGYVSDVPVRISEFRKLQLVTTRKGLTVQARDKYWAQR
jgi:VWFA-related protein